MHRQFLWKDVLTGQYKLNDVLVVIVLAVEGECSREHRIKYDPG